MLPYPKAGASVTQNTVTQVVWIALVLSQITAVKYSRNQSEVCSSEENKWLSAVSAQGLSNKRELEVLKYIQEMLTCNSGENLKCSNMFRRY